MPFPKQDPKPFTRSAIENLKPGQIGCYALFKEGLCIYVGKGDIRERLLDHFDLDNECITRHQPTHWVDVVTGTHDARERALILELSPVCNRRVG